MFYSRELLNNEHRHTKSTDSTEKQPEGQQSGFDLVLMLQKLR
jgi:hypothetical protein